MKSILVVMVLFFAAVAAQASHLLGATIEYQAINSGTYLVRVHGYFDCRGMAAPDSIQLLVSAPACSITTETRRTLRKVSDKEISQVCASYLPACGTGSLMVPGVKEVVYSGLVYTSGIVPGGCSELVFGYQECCRPSQFVCVLVGPAADIYNYCSTNNLPGISNQSVVFTGAGVPFQCINDTIQYNPGAVDPDGDSLVFSLAPALSRNGPVSAIPLPYAPYYSATNPFGMGSQTTINPRTGHLTYKARLMGLYIPVIQVDEYRKINGAVVKVGTVRKEMPVEIVNCTTPPPAVGAVTGGAQLGNNFQFVAGDTTCLRIPVLGMTSFVSYSITTNADLALPGAFWSIDSSGLSPVLEVCWVPDSTLQSRNPFSFTVQVADNACPYPNRKDYTISVEVAPRRMGAQEQQQSIATPATLLGPADRFFLVQAEQGPLQLSIYNLVGQQVYQSQRYGNNWSGGHLPSGLYLYQAQPVNGQQVMRGYVYLLR